MTQPFKVCPQCHTPAEMNAISCVHCGRLYQSTSPTVNQTQVFSPGGLPNRLSQIRTSGVDPLVPVGPVLSPMEFIRRHKRWIPAAIIAACTVAILSQPHEPEQIEDRHIVTEYTTAPTPPQTPMPVTVIPEAYMGPEVYMRVQRGMSFTEIQNMVGGNANETVYVNPANQPMSGYQWKSGSFVLGVDFDANGVVKSIVVMENKGANIRKLSNRVKN